MVDSSYITVNSIKYIEIPNEGILMSWVRNKLFSLLLQMKTSPLFCRETCPWLTGLPWWSPPGPLQPTASCCCLLGSCKGGILGTGPVPPGSGWLSCQQAQGIDPLTAWEMTRQCGEGERSGPCCWLWVPVCSKLDCLRTERELNKNLVRKGPATCS